MPRTVRPHAETHLHSFHRTNHLILFAIIVLSLMVGCNQRQGDTSVTKPSDETSVSTTTPTADRTVASDGGSNKPQAEASAKVTGKATELATFGAGCFWCVEAVFQEVNGVHSVLPGYTGGGLQNPTYEQVCSGTTGHAEVCQIEFDPSLVTYTELLEIFWKTHDPTTLNRQGYDEGTQYRSAVFYHSPEQQKLAVEYKQKLDASGAFDRPIVTEIVPFTKFYVAEDYHKDYYRSNPGAGYCNAVIRPKMDKFRAVFRDKLKAESAGPEGNR